MVLVVEHDECLGRGAGSELPAAPEQPPGRGTGPDQGVELETSAGSELCFELGGCGKASG